MPKNMGPRCKKLVFNFVLNFRRVTHFRLCPLETQVTYYPNLEGANMVINLTLRALIE